MVTTRAQRGTQPRKPVRETETHLYDSGEDNDYDPIFERAVPRRRRTTRDTAPSPGSNKDKIRALESRVNELQNANAHLQAEVSAKTAEIESLKAHVASLRHAGVVHEGDHPQQLSKRRRMEQEDEDIEWTHETNNVNTPNEFEPPPEVPTPPITTTNDADDGNDHGGAGMNIIPPGLPNLRLPPRALKPPPKNGTDEFPLSFTPFSLLNSPTVGASLLASPTAANNGSASARAWSLVDINSLRNELMEQERKLEYLNDFVHSRGGGGFGATAPGDDGNGGDGGGDAAPLNISSWPYGLGTQQ